MKLTPHFTLEELTHTDEKEFKQLNYDEGLKVKDKLIELAKFAENIRSIIESPMTITSGFRCEQLNTKIGGSPFSQHRFAEAIDFIPLKMSAFEAFSKIMISGISYGQLILEKRGVGYILHISLGTKRQKLYQAKVGGKYENIL